MEKITFYITKKAKVELTDFLVDQKYMGSWDDWVYDQLKNAAIFIKNCLMNESVKTNDGKNIKITQEKVDSIKLERNKQFKSKGDQSILVIGMKLYDGLVDAYKVQKIFDKQSNMPDLPSFDAFIQRTIDGLIQNILVQSYSKELDEERPKKEKTSS